MADLAATIGTAVVTLGGSAAAKSAATALTKQGVKAAAKISEAAIKKELQKAAVKVAIGTKVVDMAAKGFHLAQEEGKLDFASLDPTGIADVMRAYDALICQ